MTCSLDSWNKFKSQFNNIWHSEKGYTAELLHPMHSNEMNLVYLFFLQPTIMKVQLANKAFEVITAKPLNFMNNLGPLIESHAKTFVLLTCGENPPSSDLDGYACPMPYLGYEVEKKVREMKGHCLILGGQDVFTEHCVKFLCYLFKELKLQKTDNINILREAAHLSPTNTLKVVKKSLIPLTELGDTRAQTITVMISKYEKDETSSTGKHRRHWVILQ